VTRRFAALALALLAGGCATLPAPAPGDDWPARRAVLQALGDWALDGRIAVAAGDEGFSGGFDWHQQGSRADIALTGPMGGAAVDIRAEGDRAVVSVAGDVYEGEDAAALCATGSSVRRRRSCRTRKPWVRTGGSRRCTSPAGRSATTATSRSASSRCRRAWN
jgi:outer membrane biogenesis lipoprotein LolB